MSVGKTRKESSAQARLFKSAQAQLTWDRDTGMAKSLRLFVTIVVDLTFFGLCSFVPGQFQDAFTLRSVLNFLMLVSKEEQLEVTSIMFVDEIHS